MWLLELGYEGRIGTAREASGTAEIQGLKNLHFKSQQEFLYIQAHWKTMSGRPRATDLEVCVRKPQERRIQGHEKGGEGDGIRRP